MACRLRTANDRDALIEYLAEETWDARVSNMPEEVSCSEAGATWQSAFREMAVGAIQALERV